MARSFRRNPAPAFAALLVAGGFLVLGESSAEAGFFAPVQCVDVQAAEGAIPAGSDAPTQVCIARADAAGTRYYRWTMTNSSVPPTADIERHLNDPTVPASEVATLLDARVKEGITLPGPITAEFTTPIYSCYPIQLKKPSCTDEDNLNPYRNGAEFCSGKAPTGGYIYRMATPGHPGLWTEKPIPEATWEHPRLHPLRSLEHVEVPLIEQVGKYDVKFELPEPGSRRTETWVVSSTEKEDTSREVAQACAESKTGKSALDPVELEAQFNTRIVPRYIPNEDVPSDCDGNCQAGQTPGQLQENPGSLYGVTTPENELARSFSRSVTAPSSRDSQFAYDWVANADGGHHGVPGPTLALARSGKGSYQLKKAGVKVENAPNNENWENEISWLAETFKRDSSRPNQRVSNLEALDKIYDQYAAQVRARGETFEVPRSVLLIPAIENDYSSLAHPSSVGAIGPCQIRKADLRDYGLHSEADALDLEKCTIAMLNRFQYGNKYIPAYRTQCHADIVCYAASWHAGHAEPNFEQDSNAERAGEAHKAATLSALMKFLGDANPPGQITTLINQMRTRGPEHLADGTTDPYGYPMREKFLAYLQEQSDPQTQLASAQNPVGGQ